MRVRRDRLRLRLPLVLARMLHRRQRRNSKKCPRPKAPTDVIYLGDSLEAGMSDTIVAQISWGLYDRSHDGPRVRLFRISRWTMAMGRLIMASLTLPANPEMLAQVPELNERPG